MTLIEMADWFRAFLGQVRRRDASSRIQDAARRHAREAGSDSDARGKLAAELSEVPRSALVAEIAAWHPRDDYVSDRAYRLLVGVRDGGEVPPIRPEFRARFAREAEIGRLPLDEAFARIAAAVPELADIEQKATGGKPPKPNELKGVLESLGGPSQGATELAVVWRHLRACARGEVDRTPLFDHDVIRRTHGSVKIWPDT